ncbi:MAG: DUF4012 domain-containing protein [Acidimicrobiales bacterium]
MVAAAIGAARAGAEPTGVARLDSVMVPGFAAIITLAGASAKRWTLVPLSLMPALAALSVTWAVLPLALLLEAVSGGPNSVRSARISGGLLAGLAIQLLLRIPPIAFFGTPSILTFLAVAPALTSFFSRMSRRKRRRVSPMLVPSGVAVGLYLVSLAWITQGVQSDVASGLEAADAATDAAARGDQERTVASLESATDSFRRANDRLSSPPAKIARLIPGLSQQFGTTEIAVAQATLVSRTAHGAAVAFDPSSLYSASGWIDFDQLALAGAAAAAMSAAVDDAGGTLRSVDRAWLLPQLDRSLDESLVELDRLAEDLMQTNQAVETLPGLLGADGEQRILVLLSTPAETREMGGFVGSYALLAAEPSGLSIVASGPISELAHMAGPIDDPTPFSDWYLRYDLARYPQNLTGTPDLRVALEAAKQIFPVLYGRPIDSVAYVDPVGISAFVEVLGTVSLPDSRTVLNAAQTQEFLLRGQYFEWPDSEEQNQLLSEMLESVFEDFIAAGLPTPNRIGQIFGPKASGGHIAVATGDPEANDFLTSISLLREFPDFDHDFLSVRQVNAAPSKLDAYLERSIGYVVTFDPETGRIDGTVTVEIQSVAPSGLALTPSIAEGESEDGEKAMHDILLSLFTPHQATDVAINGRPSEAAVFREYGLNRAMARVEMGLGRSATVEYSISGSLLPGDYELMISKQPVAELDRLIVAVSAADGWTLTPDRVALQASRFRLRQETSLIYRATVSGSAGQG